MSSAYYFFGDHMLAGIDLGLLLYACHVANVITLWPYENETHS